LPSNTALTVGPKLSILVKTFNQYTFSLTNVVLAKNLVGKQFGKGFYESKDLTDFENYKEGDRKFHTRSCKGLI
jgi:isoleucyl-tRNA synthetase